MNSLDYDLLLWLIYQTHKNYSKKKKLTSTFLYTDIKESFKKKMNTNSIKDSLRKIDELKIISNYLQSYGSKKRILHKPFEIKILTNDSNISNGFTVTTTEVFMKQFDNPTPKVEVNYQIVKNLKPLMSKLLYLFLRDSYGGYKDIERYRNVGIDELKDILNVSDNTSHSNFITQMKKSIKVINEKSNITVRHKVKKFLNPKSGNKEIESVRFTIKLDEKKLLKKSESIIKIETQPNEVTDTESVELIFKDYLQSRIEEEFKKSYHSGIKSIGGYKNKIKISLMDKGIEDEFEIVKILSTEKQKLKSKITDNQPYEIILRHIDDDRESLSINNEFLLNKFYYGEMKTKTKSDTLQTINEMMGEYYFDIKKCSWDDKDIVGRI
jgi:hypothetical protein